MAKRLPRDLPTHVAFPADWAHLATHRIGPFITRVIHRRPDGSLHVWSSRRHRKGRGGVLHQAESALASCAMGVDEVHAHTGDRERRFRPWCWKMQSLSWWVGLIFILGSICFVVGTVPPAFPSILDWLGIEPFNFGLVDFAGSVFFTVGSYLLMLEALNADIDATLWLKAENIPVPPNRRIRWFGWEPSRIDYWIAGIQLTGAIIFNINCGMALVPDLGWVQADLLVWTPSTIASCCFVGASYLGMIEVSHRLWSWLWWDVSWNSCFFSLLGSLGFLISSLVGYFAQGPVQFSQWFGDIFALMLGSCFFLISTYLLIPELATEEAAPPKAL